MSTTKDYHLDHIKKLELVLQKKIIMKFLAKIKVFC